MSLTKFFGVIYEDLEEANPEFTYEITEGQYGTNINGGYEAATTSALYESLKGYPILTRSLYKHHVIFDNFGTRVFEGRILRVSDSPSKATITSLGYYSEAKLKTMGLLYLTPGDGGTATSISDLVEDAIALVPSWRQTNAFILPTTTDITPQDFTGEAKVKDAIEGVLSWGDDSTPPNPLHFQMWDWRTPHLVIRSDVRTDSPDFRVSIWEHIGDSLTTTVSTEHIYNKIQVLYDDPSIGPDFTSWYQDTISQDAWGVREGSYTLGETIPALADLVAELALENYKDPERAVGLTLGNLSFNAYRDGPRPLYKLRGNDIIRIVDLPGYTLKDFGAPAWGLSDTQGLVIKTNYNIAGDSMTVTLGGKNPRFEALMARLGLSTGDVS